MPSKRVTIREIAAATGVSWVTVSRILSHGTAKHAPETCARVLAAAQAMGYRPNASARSMQSGRFDNVTLLLSDDWTRSIISQQLLETIVDALAEGGLGCTVARMGDERLTDPAYVPGMLQAIRSDGLLINYVAAIPPALVDLVESHQLPAVWINSMQPDNCVLPDDLGGGRLAGEHLAALGHRRVAWLETGSPAQGPFRHQSMEARRQGLTEAMAAAGGMLETWRAAQPVPREERETFIAAHLQRRPAVSAVVTYGTGDAMSLALVAAGLGLAIPRDLSLVVFHNAVSDLGFLRPTTVLLSDRELGRQAVAALRHRLAHPERSLAPQLVPCTLAPGASSGPPPA